MLYYTTQPPAEAFQRILQCGSVESFVREQPWSLWRRSPQFNFIEVEWSEQTVLLRLTEKTQQAGVFWHRARLTLTAAPEGGTLVRITTRLNKQGLLDAVFVFFFLFFVVLLVLGKNAFWWGLGLGLGVGGLLWAVQSVRDYQNLFILLRYVLKTSGFDIQPPANQ